VNRIAISFFFALPTSFALLLMIICSFLMCYHVFRTELRTLRKST
jgi:cbb3-type cytochrome oxidase subunit 3